MDEAFSEIEITPAVSENSKHAQWMKAALDMGEKALEHGETPVGCVLVHNDKIVGRGMNDTNRSMNNSLKRRTSTSWKPPHAKISWQGTRHAEFLAIAEFLQSFPKSALQSTDLYVTVEPCIMCASALRQYRIRSVYFGCANDRFGGTGGVLTIHADRSIDSAYPVYGGLFQKEAIMLLRRFYIQENTKAPVPRAKKHRELNTAFDQVREITATNGVEVLPSSQ
ncbi:tRNA-specific adenosine deaminase subunit tad2 [Penicillium diatomitis]|uniref:tRNA-specific adenosine deaminase subunit tad2 n=1 Tax=Penicillium diatomitis TaxID=2819901 RepID=A0A9X0BSI0_9EURO|nr:tRNA-specific adenosine deaminase subunit tad2 [Penicillium diatomitis]KAJ5480983.1 tRNA-specific adenosine deaminase subunit tad2 [Penicillium diatomitis]